MPFLNIRKYERFRLWFNRITRIIQIAESVPLRTISATFYNSTAFNVSNRFKMGTITTISHTLGEYEGLMLWFNRIASQFRSRRTILATTGVWSTGL